MKLLTTFVIFTATALLLSSFDKAQLSHLLLPSLNNSQSLNQKCFQVGPPCPLEKKRQEKKEAKEKKENPPRKRRRRW